MMVSLAITTLRAWFPFVICSLLILPLVTSNDQKQSKYVLKEVEVTSVNGEPVRIYTSEELKQYDGTNSKEPILMGIKGVVFDVSEGERFYGKDSPYNVLVGKDSSRAVAKMSLDEADLTHDLTGLSDSTLKSLDDVFEGTYLPKYPVVGYMDYLLDTYPEKFAGTKTTKSEL